MAEREMGSSRWLHGEIHVFSHKVSLCLTLYLHLQLLSVMVLVTGDLVVVAAIREVEGQFSCSS